MNIPLEKFIDYGLDYNILFATVCSTITFNSLNDQKHCKNKHEPKSEISALIHGKV